MDAAAAGTNWLFPVVRNALWQGVARSVVSNTYWTVTTYKHEACDLELQTLTSSTPPTRSGR
ncbi:hypothetical protein HC928_20845 [bacterium]|nr:hypothetical protein [bacterium]